MSKRVASNRIITEIFKIDMQGEVFSRADVPFESRTYLDNVP